MTYKSEIPDFFNLEMRVLILIHGFSIDQAYERIERLAIQENS